MSLKYNFLFSTILTISGYFFQLITYPYVSRVLGVTSIGVCNFVDSIINYFVMFAAMGVATIGIREISAYKDVPERRDSIYSSLIFIHSVLTIFAVIILTICIYVIPQFEEYKKFFFIGVLKLIGSLFLIEWFYKGMENFKLITQFSLFVKFLYVICIFIFVRDANDTYIYYLLCILMTTVNALFNFIYARKYISFSFKKIEIKKYIKPNFIYGFYFILGSMYTSFNVMYLGLVAGPTQVGYYATANKIITLVIALFSAFTNVMLPRMSSILHEKNYDDFSGMIGKSVDVLFAFAFPVIVLFSLYSRDIIFLLSGEGYEGAIIPSCIMMPLILIIGYEQILVVQIQMPMKLDNGIMLNSIVGALVGLLLNFSIVRNFAAVGSSVVWIFSELAVLVTAQILVTRATSLRFPYMMLLKYIMSYAPLVLILYLLSELNFEVGFVRLIFNGAVTFAYTLFLQLLFLKSEFVINIYKQIISKIR